MYNFKNIHNVQDFFNEVGANIELSLKNESNEGLIVLTNEFGESDEFLNFNELNKYANDYLQMLIENDLEVSIIEELLEDFII